MSKIFLKFGSINGNVADLAHKGWIECHKIEFEVERDVEHKSGTKAKFFGVPSLSKVRLVKTMDISTQSIFTESLVGTGNKCTIKLLRGGDKLNTYMQYDLENAVISKYSLKDHSSTDEKAIEYFEISFSIMKTTYTAYTMDGKMGTNTSAGYDLTKCVKI